MYNPDRDLEDVSAEKLESSLATVSPEVKQCVASCKHIAETAQGQNRFQSVSATVQTMFSFLTGECMCKNYHEIT